MISGTTVLIGHLGYPTESFRAPLIFNPWFAKTGIDAVVVPMGIRAEDYPSVLRSLFKLTNFRGALVTMPHKVATTALVDEVSAAAKIAGSCNAILKRPDGTLLGDMFDGAGFVRSLKRRGFAFADAKCLVVGAGGVGSAIAAAVAAENPKSIALCDSSVEPAERLGARLRQHYPGLSVNLAGNDPAGFALVVNATPLGMKQGDPLPFNTARLDRNSFVAEVVMAEEMTALLRAAAERGCRFQTGFDMLFEQIPAYLEFFGFGTATAEELRRVAQFDPGRLQTSGLNDVRSQ
jgi:shikimate dehydrogenase